MRTPEEAYAYLTALRQTHALQPASAIATWRKARSPLRRQRQRASAWLKRIWHQGRSKKSQFPSAFSKSSGVRNRATHRRPRIRRPPLSGDAPSGIKPKATPSPCAPKKKPTTTAIFPEARPSPRPHPSFAWREEVRRTLPELPEAKRARFVTSYGITHYDAEVLTPHAALADYFEAVVKAGAPGKAVANWMQTELLRGLKDSGKEITASPVSPAALAELVKLVETGKNHRRHW